MKKSWFLAAFVMLVAGFSIAQVSVNVSGYGVSVQSGSSTAVNVNSDRVGSDVQMEGVAVINDKVFIDGIEIPKGKTTYTSKKNKKTYRINWGKDGNISVSEK